MIISAPNRGPSRTLKRLLQVGVLYLLGLYLLYLVLWSFPSGNNLKDFGSFVDSGRALVAGMNPHGVYSSTYHVSIPLQGLEADCPNLNLPVSLLFFQPLAYMDPLVAFRVWYGISLGIYLLVLLLLARACRAEAKAIRIAWALCLAGLWQTLELGQIYLPLLLVATGAWLLLRQDRRLLAGMLIGVLVAFKPNFLVWPVLLLIAGYWEVALAALLSTALVSLLPALFYGPHVYVQWMAMSSTFTDQLVQLPGNGSLAGLTARFGVSWLGTALSIVLLLVLAGWTWRRRPSILAVSGLALVCSLLASPIAWTGYTLFLLPALFGRPWPILLRVAAFMLVIPIPWVLGHLQLSSWHLLVFGSLYAWPLLLILASWMRESLSEAARPTRERA